jgi:hypothetical protein
VKFAEEQKNIFMPAEPLFLPETPQIRGLGSRHLDKQLKLNSFVTILGHCHMKAYLKYKRIFLCQQNLLFLPETPQIQGVSSSHLEK